MSASAASTGRSRSASPRGPPSWAGAVAGLTRREFAALRASISGCGSKRAVGSWRSRARVVGLGGERVGERVPLPAQGLIGNRTMSSAWTTPPKAISAAFAAAPATEVGRVTVTSMTATVCVATSPETGPTAHAMPASSVQVASRRTKTTWLYAAR
ncbi:hypothetical protein GCM10020221_11900 [Streptomyces thioluteus]|uniref:Uncharacterized protein n=1 Tax=Streptomyces thioluteus TaxID=66431 RepID=A0ABN3WJ74_STRTU